MTRLDARCREPGCIKDALPWAGLCSGHRRKHSAAKDLVGDGPWRGSQERKLTDEQAVELRRMHARLATRSEIARHFGISPTTVTEYLKRKGQAT
jgi:DNA invertase Pin-like site-specific DNA recombinase